MILSPTRDIFVPQFNLPNFNLLKFPRGGARELLDRVLRAGGGQMNHLGGGASMEPLAAQVVVSNPLAAVPWVSEWKSNNNWLDSIGANHLTGINSPTFTAGLMGGATGATALASASSRYLQVASNASLQTGDVPFLLVSWINFTTLPAAAGYLIAKDSNAVREYSIYYYNGAGVDKFNFVVSANGTGDSGFMDYTAVQPAVTGTWYRVCAWHDPVNNLIGMDVNNLGIQTKSYSAGVLAGAAAVSIGARSQPAGYVNGKMDMCAFAKGTGSVPTQAILDALWNDGAGTEQLT